MDGRVVGDFDRDVRLSMSSPAKLLYLVAGGLDNRINLGDRLDVHVFRRATFSDRWRAQKPALGINATELCSARRSRSSRQHRARDPRLTLPSADAGYAIETGRAALCAHPVVSAEPSRRASAR